MLENRRGFDDVKVLVDAGGGTDATVHMITSSAFAHQGGQLRSPSHHLRRTTLPQVLGRFNDRCHCYSAYLRRRHFMKWILHGWTGEQRASILNNCRKALLEWTAYFPYDSEAKLKLTGHLPTGRRNDAALRRKRVRGTGEGSMVCRVQSHLTYLSLLGS
ncbi:hypothetical protein GW17_00062419 [Ensete ventricosum]|nr:hypothetical protein GW17_00062419 [Ensete ventricosum]